MLPYYGVFDNLAFRVDGNTVISGSGHPANFEIRCGWAVRTIEGVDRVVNNVDVLPLSPNDDRIRLAEYRAIYGQTALTVTPSRRFRQFISS